MMIFSTARTGIAHHGIASSTRFARLLSGVALTLACAFNVQAQTRDVARDVAPAASLERSVTAVKPIFGLRYSMSPVPLDHAYGISESGVVVGDVDDKAAVYVNGAVQLLNAPQGYTSTKAFAVSDNGIITGTGMSAGHKRALFWQSYTAPAKDMSGLGRFTQPTAVNSSGVVVGYYMFDGNSSPRAFRWSNATGMQDIHPAGFDLSQAFGISNSGYIAGFTNTGANQGYSHRWYPSGASGSIAPGVAYQAMENGSVYGDATPLKATLWNLSNTPTALGPSPTNHFVGRITSSGRMAGNSFTTTSAWTSINGAAPTYLPVPAGTIGAVSDMTSCGTILGAYGTTPGDFKPVLWSRIVCDQLPPIFAQ